jgi:hypothetical protein
MTNAIRESELLKAFHTTRLFSMNRKPTKIHRQEEQKSEIAAPVNLLWQALEIGPRSSSLKFLNCPTPELSSLKMQSKTHNKVHR